MTWWREGWNGSAWKILPRIHRLEHSRNVVILVAFTTTAVMKKKKNTTSKVVSKCYSLCETRCRGPLLYNSCTFMWRCGLVSIKVKSIRLCDRNKSEKHDNSTLNFLAKTCLYPPLTFTIQKQTRTMTKRLEYKSFLCHGHLPFASSTNRKRNHSNR